MTVIGITGYAQHGKDSLGRMFVERLDFTKLAFADALRQCVAVLNPFVAPNIGLGTTRYAELLERVGYEEAKKNPEVRRLLQVMGTEVARDILGPETWVNALQTKWLNMGKPNTVVTDVRFPNEARWIHQQGGLLVRVERPGYDNGISREHPSEANIATLPVELTVMATDMTELTHQFEVLAFNLGLL